MTVEIMNDIEKVVDFCYYIMLEFCNWLIKGKGKENA